ncbi:hypothetical protein Sme01_44850 [Sphaerisporangium melleum]|uniref:ANTAR domain-containing protein n=1 Tax=Sphaerisporangium melleum TaxID=321316 RepID=A0A917R126_9ACTN|nr:hypothetical protein GCM10007964_24240 [Sphaerisporangium melleum]GII72009.1 hypothetical protein Sme01_44850 [Sphaerisporangium melleum]
MTGGTAIDYAAVFALMPTPLLLLAPDLRIVEVNRAYLEATRRTRDELIGRNVFEAFPPNPADPASRGDEVMRASVERVLATGERDTVAVQRYDIPVSGSPGLFEEFWSSVINTPVRGPDGEIAWILHRLKDVTAIVRSSRLRCERERGNDRQDEAVAVELYAGALEVQRLNEQLHEAREDLRAALASRSVIAQAVGILMGRQRCAAGVAFAILSRASQNRNLKLHDLAVEIVTAVGGHPPDPGPFESLA